MADKWSQATPNGKVINLYGPTEATVAITALEYRAEYPELPNLPIGKPFSHQETMVVDNQNEPVESGEKGELWLGGDQVTDGYWQDQERTLQFFIEKEFPGVVSKRCIAREILFPGMKVMVWDFMGEKTFRSK